MANSIDMKLSGDLTSGLDKLIEASGEQVLRAGGYAGADLIRNQAIANAPEISGVLKANIIVKRLEEKSNADQRQTYIVTIRKGKFNNEGDAYYGNFVEEGHKIVGKRAKGVSVKANRELAAREYGDRRVPARPFMRPAWESLKGSVLQVMLDRMKAKIKEIQGGSQ